MGRPYCSSAVAALLSLPSARGFTASRLGRKTNTRPDVLLHSSTVEGSSVASTSAPAAKKKKLGLLTFDLDDTLYPIEPVLNEANAAFASAMSGFGYDGIQPDDIVQAGKEIRADVTTEANGKTDSDPLRPATVNHKEIRLAAIRKEMEQFILQMKLKQTAEDWATEIESLTTPVRNSAEKWARSTVHNSVVQAVYQQWEMERHHSAERHLFPDAISTLKEIKTDHPDVIVGAVTDGSANPMLMVFSLMPLFDFSISWEDDLDRVIKEQFQELSTTESADDLSWIYRLAVEKGKEMSQISSEIKNKAEGDEDIEWCWIHVGDDLAFDVGGAKTMGAKTILVDLDDMYGQTARLRVDGTKPAWSTESDDQLAAHQRMSQNAIDKVDARINHLHQLPETINELLKGE